MFMKPNQITIAQIGKAYAKLKCNLARMEWVSVETRKCSPLVAIIIYLRKMPASKIADLFHEKDFEFCCKQIAIQLNTHISYVSGFELGFSMLTTEEVAGLGLAEHLTTGKEFDLGYEDGWALAKSFE